MDHLRRPLRALFAPSRLLDVVICAAGAIICLALTGYFKMDLGRPGFLGGDHLFYLTTIKSYINGHGFQFDSQLGYPSERDYLYFPNFDLTYRIGFWLAAHVTTNPFRVMHAVYMAAILAMDGFTYWMLRRLRINPLLAMLGGLAVVLTHFMVARAFNHDAIALYVSAPLGLGLVLIIGLSPDDASLKRFLRDPFVITAILVVGCSGLYYAFYTMMLAAFVAVAASLGQRRWFPVLAAACVTASILVLVVFSAMGTDLPVVLSGQISAPVRGAYEQLLYGLDLPSLAYDFGFLPKVWTAVELSQQAAPALFANEGTGEWPSLPLGMVLIASPLIVVFNHYWRGKQNESGSAYPAMMGLCAILVVFMILFGARGGLGYLFNLLISPQVRADARLMPFLTTAAVVIACAFGEWARISGSRPIRYAVPVIVGLTLLASTHQAQGGLKIKQSIDLADPGKQALVHDVQEMLRAKDAGHLQTILPLSPGQLARSPPIREFDPYLHQLPYLYDKAGSSTRWSYGASERQAGVALSNFALSDASLTLDRARGLGFDGVLIAKSAYDPGQLDVLQRQIGGRLAPACRLLDDGFYILYAIKQDARGAPC